MEKRNTLKMGLIATTVLAASYLLGGCSPQDKDYLSRQFTDKFLETRDFATEMYVGPSAIIIDGTQEVFDQSNDDTRANTEPSKRR